MSPPPLPRRAAARPPTRVREHVNWPPFFILPRSQFAALDHSGFGASRFAPADGVAGKMEKLEVKETAPEEPAPLVDEKEIMKAYDELKAADPRCGGLAHFTRLF